MAQRRSEYARMPADDYATPAWVTDALLKVEHFDDPIWECAPGEGYMVRALKENGHEVLTTPGNFLEYHVAPTATIITNPPYKLATLFCVWATMLVEQKRGKVAMLLPMDFDAAKGRAGLFRSFRAFKAKYTLLKRIRWANLEQKAAGPSMNHAWFVWDWQWNGPPQLGWIP